MVSTEVEAAEARWLEAWTAGPTEPAGRGLVRGDRVPDVALVDERGEDVLVSELVEDGPVLLMFWRHFGCSCGVDRAGRLVAEHDSYLRAGLCPVVVGQGDPSRAAAYRAEHGIPCRVLADPGLDAYRAFGLGHWSVDRVLFDAPPEYLAHPRALGTALQEARRATRPLVDDPWRATGEFVIGTDGIVLTSHLAQHCEDYPEPRMYLAAVAQSRLEPSPPVGQ